MTQQAQQAAARANTAAPRIGEVWSDQGGIYAGVMRGRDGAPDYHLIVGPDLATAKWVKAGKTAAALDIDGRSDFTLPFRKEQALMFANVPDLFEKACYWSCEQHASFNVSVWLQYFLDGHQTLYRKDDEFRARAVRRLPI